MDWKGRERGGGGESNRDKGREGGIGREGRKEGETDIERL